MKKIIVISAVWCPSCLILNKDIKKLKEQYNDMKIERLDYDLDEEEVSKYNVGEKLPVIISVDNNIENNRLVGEKSFDELVDFLQGEKII